MVDFETIIPYKTGNLGAAYNEAMEKTDGWVLFIDHDILILRPEWYELCQKAIERYPDAGWISGVTNRIWCTGQKKAPEKNHDDILGHIKHSNDLYTRYSDQVIEYTGNRPMSGFFILTNKGAWQDVGGFKDGALGIDNDYYLKLISKSYKAYIIPGLYCYHIYDRKKYFDSKKTVQNVKVKNKISVSMIMKNEADNLPRCLESIKNFADEIVILDTGSTDDSVIVAESYGAKVIVPDSLDDLLVDTQYGQKVHFGNARNKCLEYLSDDTAWILQIDCDEELELGTSKEDIIQYLSMVRSDVNGVTLDIKNMAAGKMDCQFIAPRIFRAQKISYVNSVHNRPDVEGGKWGYINEAKMRMALRHYGYDIPEDKKKEKIERTLGLLHKRIEDNPNDSEVYFYLSQSYGWGVDDEKSIEYAIKYINCREKIRSKNLSFNDSIYHTLAAKLIHAERYKEAGEWIKKGLEVDQNNLDLYYAMVRLGLAIKEIRLIIHGAEGFLKTYSNYEEIKLTQGTRFVYNYNPESYTFCTLHLMLSLFQQGTFLKHQFDGILKELPEDMSKEFSNAFSKGIEILGFKEIEKN